MTNANRFVITFDDSAQVYEIWTLDHEWLGCADTLAEARELAEAWQRAQ